MIQSNPRDSVPLREDNEHELNNIVILKFALLGMSLIFATIYCSVYFTI
jgi:hypothetical protein